MLFVPAVSQAQRAAPALSGRVIDQTGSPLPGVAVQATSTDRQSSLATATDREGRYALTGLSAGPYTVTFSQVNFATVTRRDVTVSSTAPARIDVEMQLAANASVVVTARDTFRNLADLPNPSENLVGVANSASEGAVTGRQIEGRPVMRAGEILETVPGLISSQHSGEGKANQYYLRGFNLDHGTDFATSVAGVPINLPSHAHGQGYSDLNFLIPELVSGVQFRKGPYFAQDGDFAAAGSANVNYVSTLPKSIASVSIGEDGWGRLLVAASPRVGSGRILAALELNHNDGPWDLPDDYQRVNAVLRYSRGNTQNAFSLTGLAYAGAWTSTDQVPDRAVADGTIPRFGHVDPSNGGRTARYSVVAEGQRLSGSGLTRFSALASYYRLNLFSNFTYALDDPARGDQFEQVDRRWVSGARASHTRNMSWGDRVGENTIGLQFRHDNMPLVGLYHTSNRQRLATTRQDAVAQTSVAAFAENELRWLPWLRTTAGLRVDGYRFDVQSNDAANSGRRNSGIVSPKGGAIFGPWRDTELYVNAGMGFHSNDARGATIARDPTTGESVDRVTPLVRAKGFEVGVRTVAIPRVQTTVTVWRLGLASELVFLGDAGTTEAGRPSQRYGIEWTNYVRLSSVATIDGDLAWSHAEFTDADPAGNAVPGSAGFIASLGLTVDPDRGAFGSIRLRYFGPRPLVEDASIQSSPTTLVNGQLGYHLTPRMQVVLDAFNVFNSKASDIDYFYTSRLPDEPSGGVADVHTHPVLPRTFRVMLRFKF